MEKPLMMTIRDVYRLWSNHMRQIAAQVGVPDAYRMVLTFLLRHPGASQKELAAHCGITTASISQTVKEMQMTGYLKKEIDEKDQRYVKLYLTEKGKTCAAEIRRKLALADKRISELLTPEREKEILEGLEELSQILEKEMLTCYTT